MDLIEAIEAGSSGGLRAAIAAGAEVDRRGPGGVTPLMRAAGLGHAGLVRLLLKAGARAGLADDRGDTALIHAARNGHRLPYRILSYRTSRSDPETFERAKGLLPEPTGEEIGAARAMEERLVDAIKDGGADVVRALLAERPDSAVVSGRGDRGALEEAIRAGRIDVLRALLEAGAEADLRVNLWSPLRQAAAAGRVDLIRLLIDWGAGTEGIGPLPTTPLMAAAEAGQVASARALIEAGADVNARDHLGRSALSLAIEAGHAEMIDLLQAAGAAEADARERALAAAAKRGDLAEVEALLADGADPNQAFDSGLSALGEAVVAGHAAIVDAMMIEGPSGPEAAAEAMMRAAYLGKPDVVRALLDGGADPDADDGYRTALAQAAERGHREVVRMLLEAGADPNKPVEGPSALAAAHASGDDAIITMIHDRGAAKTFGGLTVEEFRGVTSFDVNEIWLLVRAPIEEAARGFVEARGAPTWERDVYGRALAIEPRSFLAMQFRGHAWTAIRDWACDDLFAWIKEDDARIVSERAGGRAIYFGVSDTAGALTYALFERGTLLERYSYGESEDEEGGGSSFESTLRDADPSGGLDVDAVLREHGAFVPSFGLALGFMLRPGMQAAFGVGGLEKDDFERVDYIAVPPGEAPPGFDGLRNPFERGEDGTAGDDTTDIPF